MLKTQELYEGVTCVKHKLNRGMAAHPKVGMYRRLNLR